MTAPALSIFVCDTMHIFGQIYTIWSNVESVNISRSLISLLTNQQHYDMLWWDLFNFYCYTTLFLSFVLLYYSDVIMGAMASQINSLTVAYSTVYSGADQRNIQSPASLTFVRDIYRLPVDSPHKGPVTREVLPFDDVIMDDMTWKRSLCCWFFMREIASQKLATHSQVVGCLRRLIDYATCV